MLTRVSRIGRLAATAARPIGARGGHNAKVFPEDVEWLKFKAIEEGVVKLPSGLMYKVIEAGKGTASPKFNQPCRCIFEAKLGSTGKVYYKSVSNDNAASRTETCRTPV